MALLKKRVPTFQSKKRKSNLISNFVVIPFQIDGDDYHYETVEPSIYRPSFIYGEIETYEIGFAGGDKKRKNGKQ